MAAATMLHSDKRAFFYEFLFKVSTFLPNLMKFGHKMKEQHQFLYIQDGDSRHLDSHSCVAIQSLNIHTKFGEIWCSQNERTASVFLNSRWRQPPCCILTTRRFG